MHAGIEKKNITDILGSLEHIMRASKDCSYTNTLKKGPKVIIHQHLEVSMYFEILFVHARATEFLEYQNISKKKHKACLRWLMKS